MNTQVSKLTIRASNSLVLLLITLIVLSGFGLQHAHSSPRPGRKLSIKIKGENPHIMLQTGRELEPVYSESSAGGNSLQSAGRRATTLSDQARPLALASADFDVDGFPDLVCGYAGPSGGVVTLHRGNREAFAPSDPKVLKGIAKGKFPEPFLKNALLFNVPEAPDFIATGDLNRDGNPDLIVAARASNAMYLLAGDRQGGFTSVERVMLPGAVTALMAADINERDGLTDLVIGVNSTAGGPALLVYDTAASLLVATPTTHVLSAQASSLAAGDLDDDRLGDIAFVSGNQVLILHGIEQLRTVDGSIVDQRSGQLEAVNLSYGVKAIALGEFIWDRGGRTEMAVMSEDGAVHIAARGTLDTSPMTVEEVRQARLKMARERTQADKAMKRGALSTSSKASSTGLSQWKVVEDLQVELNGSAAKPDVVSAQRIMLSTRMSGLPSDDLLTMDASGHRINVTYKNAQRNGAGQVSAQSIERSGIELESDGEMVAALPMRVNVNGRPGLVILSNGGSAPVVFTPQANSTFTVNTSLDTDDLNLGDGLCLDVNGNCSLRAAVQQANQDLTNDTIMFSPTLNATPIKLNQFGNDGNAAAGDLDINSNLTIIGNGESNTIIQGADDASFTNSIGDKIFGINQDGIYDSLTVSFSGVTIRYGRNTVAFGDPSFAYTGGGVDVFLTGLGNSVTFTNCTIDHNANAFSYGGGVNLDSFSGGNAGTVSFTGCTISNNQLQSTVFSQSGAGLNLFADNHNVSFTNCTIDGNQAQNTNFAGGVNIRHTNGGSVTIDNTNVTNNTAGSHSGGIQTSFNQTVNMNVGNITGNSAGGDGGGFNAGGTTNNLFNLTISNNTAGSGGGLFVVAGTLNVSLSRIVGNTAVTGSGVRRVGGTATVENNWWGCDGFLNATGCQSGVGVFDDDPRIDLRLLPASATLAPGGTQTFTADVSQNTDGGPINPFVLNGLTINFGNTPGMGSVSPSSAPLTALSASTTFTANSPCPSPSSGSVSATLDNGTQTSAVTMTPQPIVLSPCPASQTVNADSGQCSASVSFTPPAATGCPTPTVTCRIGATAITSPHSFPVGTTTVTCTASNGASPDQSCSFDVTVNDNQPPSITCPSNINTNENPPGSGCATVAYATPTPTDNCPGATVSCSPPSGFCFPNGSTTVTCTATDASGNTANCTFQVNVVAACTITCPANIVTGNDLNQCGAIVNFSPSTGAGCGSVTCSPSSGSFFPIGTTSVNCTTSVGPSCSFTIRVNDVQPPSITCPANVSVAGNIQGSCSANVNPGNAVATDNCPGVSIVGVRSDAQALNAPYPQGNTTIAWTATDQSGNQASCVQTVEVTNPDPVVAITGPASGSLYSIGTSVNFTGTFSDTGGTHTATWTFTSNINNFSQAGVVDESTGAVTASFTFNDAGVYLVKLTVTDSCGGTGTADTVNGLTALVVIFDPNGGFVTGGGWIDSPPGAYTPDPSLTGRASFGFFAKYKPGKSLPGGNTEFQFRTANFNFQSTEYSFMVIAGAKVTLKGTGTVNGQSGYEFTLQAIDGQVNGGGGQDKFRIRITLNNQVIYDNEITLGENDDPTTLLGGGNIVIHNDN